MRSHLPLMNINSDPIHHELLDITKKETCNNCSPTECDTYKINQLKSCNVRLFDGFVGDKKDVWCQPFNLRERRKVLCNKSCNECRNLSNGQACLDNCNPNVDRKDFGQFISEHVEIYRIANTSADESNGEGNCSDSRNNFIRRNDR